MTPTDKPENPPLSEEDKSKRAASIAKARAAKAAKRAQGSVPSVAATPAAPLKAAPEKPAEVIDPDNVTLSAERLKEIRAKAAKIVAEERLAALEKMELNKALEDIRGKEGMRTGDPTEDRIVDLTIDCGAGAVGRSPNGNELNGIRVNGREYTNGKTYPVPLHVARTLMEIMYRTHLHEHSLKDKPMSEFYRQPRHTLLTRRGAVNAPRRPDEGSPAGAA